MNKLSQQELYDEEYFEKGLISGKSCYLNFRWLPELTIKMVYHIINNLKIKETDKILDFGCAKGYTVKAFRLLDFEAYGCDVSKYAIEKVDSEVIKFCKLSSVKNIIPFKNMKFDWIMAKDVMEHLTEKENIQFLQIAREYTSKMFLVIPLGKNDRYIAPEYHKDISHILAKDKEWWIKKIENSGWNIKKFSYKFQGVKENWTSIYPKANGFFIIEKI